MAFIYCVELFCGQFERFLTVLWPMECKFFLTSYMKLVLPEFTQIYMNIWLGKNWIQPIPPYSDINDQWNRQNKVSGEVWEVVAWTAMDGIYRKKWSEKQGFNRKISRFWAKAWKLVLRSSSFWSLKHCAMTFLGFHTWVGVVINGSRPKNRFLTFSFCPTLGALCMALLT